MQKKLIALAVAGLVSGGAFAQSNVTIYGRANLGLDNWAATGSVGGAATDFKSRNRVYDTGSRLGFKGIEDLGNGLKANFVIESGVNLDTGSANGQAGTLNASTGTLASRQSYVGLSGNWGEFRLGRQEVHWTGGRINDVGANELNQNGPISTGGSGLIGGVAARTSNVLMYLTPVFSGFQFAAGYVPGSEAAAAGVSTNGKGWSVQGNYNNGPIAVKYDHTQITAADTLASGLDPVTGVPKNTGDKLMAAYFYQGDSKVGVAFNHNTNANLAVGFAGITAAGGSITQNSWVMNWEHYFGNIEAIAEYGRGNNVSGSGMISTTPGETSYKTALLAVRYLFSKRTTAYASWNQVNNGQQNWADIVGGNYSSAAGNLAFANRGADLRVYAIGMQHNF